MAQAPKKNGAILVVRDRKTIALPPAQLGSFPKFFEADDYDPAKPKFKGRFHYNPAGLTALATILQKVINKHFEEAKKQAAEAKLPCVANVEDCQSPADWIEGKLKEPHEKDRIQLPKIELSVPKFLPPKKGETEPREREIQFWNAQNELLEDPKKTLARMAAGTWVEPIVHGNLFLSKQLGKDPRVQLQFVGIRIIKLVEFGGGQAQAADAADEAAMRAIMGSDFDPDDLTALGGGMAAPQVDDEEDPF